MSASNEQTSRRLPFSILRRTKAKQKHRRKSRKMSSRNGYCGDRLASRIFSIQSPQTRWKSTKTESHRHAVDNVRPLVQNGCMSVAVDIVMSNVLAFCFYACAAGRSFASFCKTNFKSSSTSKNNKQWNEELCTKHTQSRCKNPQNYNTRTEWYAYRCKVCRTVPRGWQETRMWNRAAPAWCVLRVACGCVGVWIIRYNFSLIDKMHARHSYENSDKVHVLDAICYILLRPLHVHSDVH